MFTPKYYELIEECQTRDAKAPVDYDFDLSELKGTWLSKLTQATLQSLWFQRLLRRCWPIVRIGRLVVVSRYDDASEVLNNQDVFEAPFGREMSEMAGGTNFILGMRDDAAYQQMMRWIADAFRRDDVTKIVEPNSRKHASRVFEQSGGRIDVIRDLITGVPIKICKDYYGLDIRDEDGFAEWSIALSMLFFADPTGDPQTRRMARAAAEKLGVVIRNSIARAHKQVDGDEAKSDTILGQLIAQSSEDPALSDDVICAILTGMITGFVPTNTLAAGNILEVLLERPQALAEARSAALADDDALLEHCLFEAMRFKPPLNPGVFRYATAQFTLAKGTRRAKTIKKGSTVIVATASAMHDAAKITEPWKFSPDRSDEDDILFGKTGMLFGFGLHRCIGLEIARKQIMQTMKELLRQKSLRPARGRAGRLQKIGPFPTRLVMEYGEIESPSPLAMITLCAEISDGVVDKIKCELDELGNPAGLALKKALDDTGCLHFASMSVIEGDTKKAVPNSLVLELTADGIESDVIDTIALAAGQPLRKIFKMAELKDDEDLASFMRRHVLDVRPRFWTTVGLAFCGTPWLSVKRIRDEEALEKKVAAQLPGFDGKPLQLTLPRTVLDHIRMELKNDSRFAFAFTPAAIPFRDRRKAPWNTASEPGFWGIIPDLVRKARVASGVICVALVVVTALIYWGLTKSPGPVAQFGWVAGSFAASLILIVSLILAIVTTAVVLAIISLSLKLKLNRLEEADQPRDRDPDPEQVNDIMKLENAPRVAQNHMTAVSTMKPGWLRSFTLLGVFFVIEKLAAMEKFRPGFLSNIGTIHFARWVRLPGTNKLLFFSNYSGSWESYMEDFITMAHNGLTAVWSNTCNFPRAHNLFEDGATDGDHFKRWARGQQIPTRFWYSGYPHLTTERIRTNAMIRDGIARARSDSDAEAWLSLFHSVPRPATALEFDQIQTLAFGGMGKLEEASCILIKFGEDGGKVRAWLEETRNSLAFGETLPVRGIAQALALSASGLGACGLCTLASSSEKDALTSFPSAFLKGMADETRSKILGDAGSKPTKRVGVGQRRLPGRRRSSGLCGRKKGSRHDLRECSASTE